MATDINLLPEEEKTAESFQNLQKRLSATSIVLLVLSGLATLGILIFYTFLSSKRATLVSQIEDSSSRINSFKTTEDLVFVTKGKAEGADKALAKRLNVPNLFSKLASLVPQNVYFTDVRFVGPKLVIAGKAKTSADVAGLISSLVSPSGNEILSGVTIDSLSSDESGVYTFDLSSQVVNK